MNTTSGRLAGALALAAALCAGEARAADAELRVITPDAVVRAGPGPTFREVYRAERGEVFRVVERATVGYWLRVVLPDGTYGWILGDATLPFDVDLAIRKGRSGWSRFVAAVFAPSPLLRAHFGMTMSGGAIGGDGAFMFRPAVVIDNYFAVEAHVGEAIGKDGSLLLYGAGGDIFIWPDWPLVPFFALAVGGASSFPKLNGVTQAASSQFALDAGGGVMVVLRKRFTLRFDVRNYTLFTANTTQNRQEYSGGLAVYF